MIHITLYIQREEENRQYYRSIVQHTQYSIQ